MRLLRNAGGKRAAIAAIVATAALALLVAASVKRPPPEFSALPVVATVRDEAGRPLWAIRLAGAAHEIAVDSLAAAEPPAGHAYQLWLDAAGGPRSLGLLPVRGRKVIPEIPSRATQLLGSGTLLVTLEPARGSVGAGPSGPVAFRAAFPDRR